MHWDGDLIIISGTIITLVLGLPLVRAYVKSLELRGRRDSLQSSSEVTERLAAIESAVEAIAVEVERISENQRFTTRLLAGREGQEQQAERVASVVRR